MLCNWGAHNVLGGTNGKDPKYLTLFVRLQVYKLGTETKKTVSLRHQYHEKITDFSSENKQLNYIGAFYSTTLCVNVIVQVGFGIGSLQIDVANNVTTTFILTRGSMDSVFMFKREMIQQQLTFDWFKVNYICRDLPWICQFYT